MLAFGGLITHLWVKTPNLPPPVALSLGSARDKATVVGSGVTDGLPIMMNDEDKRDSSEDDDDDEERQHWPQVAVVGTVISLL